MATVTPSEKIHGVLIVDPDVHGDERGFFVETYRREWFPQGRESLTRTSAIKLFDSLLNNL